MSNQFTQAQGRKWWIQAQALDQTVPFGEGIDATRLAIEHLAQIQIDTINVIERCHHHILFTRIPDYQKIHLHQALSQEKTVFEFWTHVLSYLPMKDYPIFLNQMKKNEISPRWFKNLKKSDYDKVINLIKKEGPISIRDIKDDVLTEKNHPWGSRKPSNRALLRGFYIGKLVVCERVGMLKKYNLTSRHFNWKSMPKAATDAQVLEYKLERALRTQGAVSLDTICYLDAKTKPPMRALLEKKVRSGTLVSAQMKSDSKTNYWLKPELLDQDVDLNEDLTRFMSPFDPLIVPRKRLLQFFDYEHKFEAYLPEKKRQYGYFGLPVLMGDRIVAVIDLKTDRPQGKVVVQNLTWLGKNKTKKNEQKVEQELKRFEKFQLEIPPGEENV